MTSYSFDVVTTLSAAILFGSCLPALQDAKPEFPSRDELKIIVIHDDQAACAEYPKSFRCPDVKHWKFSVNEVKCADRERVEAFMKSEAKRLRTSDPKLPQLSELQIKLLAESGAPYSEVQSLMTKCANMGIYRLEVGERKTEGRGGAITSALGVRVNSSGGKPEIVVLIGKQETQEKVRWIEAPELKKVIDDDAKDLGPRDELPVLLDPTASTAWTEVIQVMDSFKKMGFERLEFAAPFKVSDTQKKER